MASGRKSCPRASDNWLAFEDLSVALAEVEAEREKRAAKAGDGTIRPTPKRTIGNLPAALPRTKEVIEPDSLNCPCGCEVMHKIGKDRTERLDIVPALLRVIVTVRPKYACRSCTDGVTRAPAPSHLIMGGLPIEATLAHVLVSNHWDRLQTFLADGRVEIDSNRVENLIRPVALNRKNAVFAGHDEGGIA